MTSRLLDSALDRTVVGGYTSIGYRIRSRAWNDAELPRMDGKVVLVTGASSGLGLGAAEGFGRLGATVWLVVRSASRGEVARRTLVSRSGNRDVRVGLCDLSELASVRQFAECFIDQAPRLDVLVNNAGVMSERPAVSPDGIELTLATNVVGPFLLTSLLAPLLERSAPSRVVNVSSGGMYTQRLRVEDLESEGGEFDGPTAYARTKRAQVVLTELWANRLKGTGVVVHAMHPGWADTSGLRSSLPRFSRLTRPLLRTPEQGADTIVWLGAAAEPGQSSGGFWHDRRQRTTNLLPWTREISPERDRLWALCARLSGLSPSHVGAPPMSSSGTER
ncbi:MAG: SDR family NAD(P)-dependent oxidoreductase [Actinomycetota bacterium]|nr:SDR family NAD(P)-dependent oxidoreductase [Actinomycetota bacterium]